MVDSSLAVTAEVIRNGLLVAVEEGADACAALLDAKAQLEPALLPAGGTRNIPAGRAAAGDVRLRTDAAIFPSAAG